ncbi:MAG: DNA repair protein RadA [Lachnospiraceae bacterium]|nr:DNA repair protein RadA [Lachnospiraceae bacterium]
MAKIKTVFYCQECGHESVRWLGQCPSCRKWNTFVEEKVRPEKGDLKAKAAFHPAQGRSRPSRLSEIVSEREDRVLAEVPEFDRVLGGGIVPGSLVLVGGDPGIGKSTLLLQIGIRLARRGKKILYVSGEESLNQIKLRSDRIWGSEEAFPDSFLLYCETDLSEIEAAILDLHPQMVIIDSIQTMFSPEMESAPGSVSQIRETASLFMRIAKEGGISVFLIGHVTKEGTVAGPKILEHMVDTVLYFEGDRFASYRILRAIKNRFGRTNEIGVFEMREAGLAEVSNPSEFMLSGRPDNASGSIISCAMEGSRALLIEIQALVSPTNFGYPKRQANGTDYNRVNLLMAVLEKRVGLKTGSFDAYVNLAGGMKIEEPALDLGIVLAMASSFLNVSVDRGLVAFGEVGLSGEVRAIRNPLERALEAKKLGFTTILFPKASEKALREAEGLILLPVSDVSQAIQAIRQQKEDKEI